MRGHAETIARRDRAHDRALGRARRASTCSTSSPSSRIYTSSACLIGPEFRDELERRARSALPRPRARHRRDRLREPVPAAARPSARATAPARGSSRSCEEIFERRAARGPRGKDLFQILPRASENPDGSARYDVDTITGMFISLMFAGHHTTSTTASWTLIELLPPPGAGWRASSPSSTRSTPTAARSATRRCARSRSSRASFKETLRLHPPLILLMRKVMQRLPLQGLDASGRASSVGVSPAVSNRMPERFPRAGALRPGPLRAAAARRTSSSSRWHPVRRRAPPLRRARAFAMMQLKAIFCDPAAALRVRARAAARELPERPLEDGRAARAALSRALPAARRRARPRRTPRGREPRATARGACASRRPRSLPGPRRLRRARRPRSSALDPKTAKVELLDPSTARPSSASRAELADPPLSDPCAAPMRATGPHPFRPDRRRIARGVDRMPAFPRDELEEMIRRLVAANDEAAAPATGSRCRTSTPRTRIYTWNNGPEVRVRRARPQGDPRLRVRHRDGRPRQVDLPVRAHADRRPEGRGHRHLAPDRAGRTTTTASRTRSPAPAARGSATRATASGAGSATSSTTAAPAPCSST